MYGIYLENQRIATAKTFEVLPSGAILLGETRALVEMVIAPGSWDHVAWEDDLR